MKEGLLLCYNLTANKLTLDIHFSKVCETQGGIKKYLFRGNVQSLKIFHLRSRDSHGFIMIIQISGLNCIAPLLFNVAEICQFDLFLGYLLTLLKLTSYFKMFCVKLPFSTNLSHEVKHFLGSWFSVIIHGRWQMITCCYLQIHPSIYRFPYCCYGGRSAETFHNCRPSSNLQAKHIQVLRHQRQ